jgi:hypothetical protein
MSNIELYNNYVSKRSQVETLQTQIQSLNAQLYTAENELLVLKEQVEIASQDALLNSLL